jgi:hypothetical protein
VDAHVLNAQQLLLWKWALSRRKRGSLLVLSSYSSKNFAKPENESVYQYNDLDLQNVS